MAMPAFQESDQAAFAFETMSPMAAPKPTPPGEMRLRSLEPGHQGRFTAWRGRSGRRYVASAFALGDDDALSFADCVLIAVDRARAIVAVREAGPWGVEAAVSRWRNEVGRAGAVEIHVHLIAATAEERRRAVADLMPTH